MIPQPQDCNSGHHGFKSQLSQLGLGHDQVESYVTRDQTTGLA